MAKFTRTFSKVYQVEGREVTVKFSRMKRKHAMLAAPMINAYNEEAAQGTADMKAVSMEQSLSHMDIASQVLEDCIVGIDGLKIESDEGFVEVTHDSPLFKDEILDGVYFMGFVSEMIGDLMAESFVAPETVKKPEAAQAGSSTE